jgi:hypothetical protein
MEGWAYDRTRPFSSPGIRCLQLALHPIDIQLPMAQPQLHRVDRHHETSIFLLSRFPYELAAVAHLACVEAGKRLAGEVVEGGRDVFRGDGGDLAVDGSFVAVEVDLRGKEGKGKKQYVELELTTEKR